MNPRCSANTYSCCWRSVCFWIQHFQLPSLPRLHLAEHITSPCCSGNFKSEGFSPRSWQPCDCHCDLPVSSSQEETLLDYNAERWVVYLGTSRPQILQRLHKAFQNSWGLHFFYFFFVQAQTNINFFRRSHVFLFSGLVPFSLVHVEYIVCLRVCKREREVGLLYLMVTHSVKMRNKN